MYRFLTRLIVISAIVFAAATPAAAQFSPMVNLGFTSFHDGEPIGDPGFHFQEYIQYYTAKELTDSLGNDMGLLHKQEIWISHNQFIYQSDQPVFFGGKWGIDVVVPLVHIKNNPDKTFRLVTDGSSGLGDIVVGPFIQWDPIMGEDGPIFSHRIELQNIIPTGEYDDDHPYNAGSNFYSFNPYWAGTVWLTPKWTASWRLHYLWNDKNDDPFGGVKSTQAGQAIHINFATAIELLPNQLDVGINGYYFDQITDSKTNGRNMPYQERVFGIGPGAAWHISKDDHLLFNLYIESTAENRTEGTRMTLRWTHHF